MRLCVAPAVLAGQLDNQLADVYRSPRATDLGGLALAFPGLANSAAQCIRTNDGHQFAEGLAQLGAERDQAVAFGLLSRAPGGATCLRRRARPDQ
jgi:hypothetical protein